MKLKLRGGIAAIAIAGSAIIAAGCGGSDASSAARGAAALDFVPKDALGYVTVDTDFGGDNWSRFSELAKAFDPDFDSIEDQIAKSASGEGDDIDFAKDVDPWLGDGAGAALLADGSEVGYFAWIEIDDRDAFEDFAKKEDLEEQDAKFGDFQVWNDGDDAVLGVSDDLVVFTDTEDELEQVLEFDGDPITDADGVGDAIDGVDGDSIATLVVNGAGVREAAEGNEDLKGLAETEQLKDFQALALSFSAKEDGFRVDGRAVSSGDNELENGERELFEDVPTDTLLAVGGHDLGGQLSDAIASFGKEDADAQQQIGQIEGLLGVDTDDLAEALDGEFVLGVSASDAGLGSLAGGIAGAVMGGGSFDASNASGLLQAGTILLAFEETGDTAATLDKLASAVGSLSGGRTTARATGTSERLGDFTVKQLNVNGLPVTQAANDDVAALSIGVSPFQDWGKETLADNDAYKDAWEAADAPDSTFGTLWLDAGRIAKLVGVTGSDDAQLGGLVGWIEGDGSDADFGAFLHVTEG